MCASKTPSSLDRTSDRSNLFADDDEQLAENCTFLHDHTKQPSCVAADPHLDRASQVFHSESAKVEPEGRRFHRSRDPIRRNGPLQQ